MPAAAFTRAEFLAWLSLLEAALDQPAPTRALRRAIGAVQAPGLVSRGVLCGTCGADSWIRNPRPGRAYACARCFDGRQARRTA